MPRFIGRSRELARLLQLVDSGESVLVMGLRGAGKRSLVEQLTARRPTVRVGKATDGDRGGTIVVAEQWVAGWRGAVLRLAGLSWDEALALWRTLDVTSGAVAGFAAAYRRTSGHPAALIAAHDGLLVDAGAQAVIDGLSREERQAALVLAEVRGALPLGELRDLAIPSLTDKLVIEAVGVGWWRLTPRLAAPLLAAAAADEIAAARARAAELEAMVAARLSDAERAARELGPRLAERRMAELPAELRTAAVRRARARMLVELLDTHRARAVIDGLSEGDPETAALRAELALRAGRVEEAAGVLAVAPDGRLASWLACLRGEAFEADVTPSSRAWLAWWRGDDEALDEASRDAGPDDLALVFFRGWAEARRGRVDQATRCLDALRSAVVPDEQPRAQILLRLLTARIDEERGERLRARGELEAVAAAFESAGETPFALAIRLETARLDHVLGRRRVAAATIGDVERRAAQLGLRHLGEWTRRAAAADLSRTVWRARDPVPEWRTAAALRDHAIGAVQAATSGHNVIAGIHLRMLADLPPAEDYAVDRVLVSLAQSALDRVSGATASAGRRLTEATEHAAAGGVDAELVAALVSMLSRDLLVTPRRRRLAVGTNRDLKAASVVVDATRHEIRGPGGIITLDRRPVLARLLYAVAARPGEELDKDTLTKSLWGVLYNPLVHDNALKANVHRLNRMIAAAGLTVTFHDLGYRLTAPDGFLFVDKAGGSPEMSQRGRTS